MASIRLASPPCYRDAVQPAGCRGWMGVNCLVAMWFSVQENKDHYTVDVVFSSFAVWSVQCPMSGVHHFVSHLSACKLEMSIFNSVYGGSMVEKEFCCKYCSKHHM